MHSRHYHHRCACNGHHNLALQPCGPYMCLAQRSLPIPMCTCARHFVIGQQDCSCHPECALGSVLGCASDLGESFAPQLVCASCAALSRAHTQLHCGGGSSHKWRYCSANVISEVHLLHLQLWLEHRRYLYLLLCCRLGCCLLAGLLAMRSLPLQASPAYTV